MSNNKPLCVFSRDYALEHNQRDIWKESYRENCNCARAIERAIAEHYKDNRLGVCAPEIISRYGFDRVNWVLANTIQEKNHDGRFSKENKSWANKHYIPQEDTRWYFTVESHPGLVNMFVDQAREAWSALGLFDTEHCESESIIDMDLTNKICILKGTALKEEYRKPEFQLFLACSGFGCKPDALGTKVFGKFLIDDEDATFVRADFIGVIKEECLPEWATEKMTKMHESLDLYSRH